MPCDIVVPKSEKKKSGLKIIGPMHYGYEQPQKKKNRQKMNSKKPVKPVKPSMPTVSESQATHIAKCLVLDAAKSHSNFMVRRRAEEVASFFANMIAKARRYDSYGPFRTDLNTFLEVFTSGEDPIQFVTCMSLVGWGRYVPSQEEFDRATAFRETGTDPIPTVEEVIAEQRHLLGDL